MKSPFSPIALVGLVILTLYLCACASVEKKGVRKSESSGEWSQRHLFDSSKKRRTVRTTAYSHRENEPGAHGRLSAAGNTLRYGRVRSAAADWSVYPLGTRFRIAGKPHIYEIDDYGSALVGTGTIDLFFPTLRQMNDWGTRMVNIEILSWGCFERSAELLAGRTQYPHCREMYYRIPGRYR